LGLLGFVLVRLGDPKFNLVWMGKAKSEVVKNEQFDNFRHVHIQWWVLVKKVQRMIKICIMNVG
jgi:hypothetical protein